MSQPFEAKICSVEGCESRVQARGWCGLHYQRWYKFGDPLRTNPVTLCSVEGCDKPARSRGMCSLHYSRLRRYGDPLINPHRNQGRICEIEGCEKPAKTRGWCSMHYSRWHVYGDPRHNPLPNKGRICNVEGCEEPAKTRGMCGKHYQRFFTYGDPLHTPRKKRTKTDQQTTEDKHEKILTIKEVAEIFQLSEETIEEWAEQEILPSINLVGNVRFIQSHVDAFIRKLRSQVEQPTPPKPPKPRPSLIEMDKSSTHVVVANPRRPTREEIAALGGYRTKSRRYGGDISNSDRRQESMMEYVSMVIEEDPGIMAGEITAALEGDGLLAARARRFLEHEGYIESWQEGKRLHHYSVKPFRMARAGR
jgi:predicted DNA-binding transcriptional regulator AlpA